jgi:flagellar hook assembly protein FlgD
LEAAALGALGMHRPASVATINDLNISIYPNPSSGATRISVNLPTEARLDMSIINSSGQVIYSTTGKIYPQGDQLIEWDGKSNSGADVQSGYYFVKITAGKYVSVDKLLLMR